MMLMSSRRLLHQEPKQNHRAARLSSNLFARLFHLYQHHTSEGQALVMRLLGPVWTQVERAGTRDVAWMLAACFVVQVTSCGVALVEVVTTCKRGAALVTHHHYRLEQRIQNLRLPRLSAILNLLPQYSP